MYQKTGGYREIISLKIVAGMNYTISKKCKNLKRNQIWKMKEGKRTNVYII